MGHKHSKPQAMPPPEAPRDISEEQRRQAEETIRREHELHLAREEKRIQEEFEKQKAIWEQDRSQPEPVFKSREQLLKEYPTLDSTNNFNYAICGQSGVGKSSFINALLGLHAREEGAAKVGHIECTMTPWAYSMPGQPCIKFWDMPGAGTRAHPASTYFMDKALYAFDCVVIVMFNRVGESDISTMRQALAKGLPVAFVRSKADVDIVSVLSDTYGLTEEEATVADRENAFSKLRDDTIQELRKQASEIECSLPDPLEFYLVSSRVLLKVTNGTMKEAIVGNEQKFIRFLFRASEGRFSAASAKSATDIIALCEA